MGKNQENARERNFKTLKYGGSTTLMIIIFIAILLFVNIFAGYITERFSFKKDMTEEQIFTISEAAKEALKGVKEDVDIYILTKEATVQNDDVISNAVELIGLYNTETGGHISYEFLDRHTNQEFYEDHPEARDVNDTAIVVQSAKRYIVLDSYDFYDFAKIDNTLLTNKKRYQTEEKLVGAILYAVSDDVSNGGFVTGHEESEPTMLKEIFESNSFKVEKSVNLTNEVPSDINNLVISVPQMDFSETEIQNLDKYLSKEGNNLYVFIDGYVPELPVFERYLSEWGLKFEYEAVYDPEESYYNIGAAQAGEGKRVDGTHILATPKNNNEFKSEKPKDLPIIVPYMRPITSLIKGDGGYVRNFEILSTFDSAMGVVTTLVDGSYQQQISSYGPFSAGVIAERANGKYGADGISRIIAFGSSAFADSKYLSSVPNAYNKTFISDVVSYANPEQQLIKVEPKIVTSNDLVVYKDDIDMLFWVLVVIMPTVILGAGIVIFALRRRK